MIHVSRMGSGLNRNVLSPDVMRCRDVPLRRLRAKTAAHRPCHGAFSLKGEEQAASMNHDMPHPVRTNMLRMFACGAGVPCKAGVRNSITFPEGLWCCPFVGILLEEVMGWTSKILFPGQNNGKRYIVS